MFRLFRLTLGFLPRLLRGNPSSGRNINLSYFILKGISPDLRRNRHLSGLNPPHHRGYTDTAARVHRHRTSLVVHLNNGRVTRSFGLHRVRLKVRGYTSKGLSELNCSGTLGKTRLYMRNEGSNLKEIGIRFDGVFPHGTV